MLRNREISPDIKTEGVDEQRLQRIKNRREMESKLSKTKTNFYIIVLFFKICYCILEIAVAISVDSLALLSDGFHNAGDLMALVIAWWCEKNKNKRSNPNFTYGYQRIQLVGGLANGWSLAALGGYIVLESLPRFYSASDTEWSSIYGNVPGINLSFSVVFILIATFGVVMNTVAALVFGGHGHGHGHGHNHKAIEEEKEESLFRTRRAGDEVRSDSECRSGLEIEEQVRPEEHGHQHGSDLNMRAMFIHQLGDSLSSFIILGEGIAIKYGHGVWLNYLDPSFSLLIVAIIFATTIPLLKECSRLVLQASPVNVDILKIKEDLLKVPNVFGIHDFHVWTLSPEVIICSLHFQCPDTSNVLETIASLKVALHKFGIHSSAIQPELVKQPEKPSRSCEENCVKSCERAWCCNDDVIYGEKDSLLPGD